MKVKQPTVTPDKEREEKINNLISSIIDIEPKQPIVKGNMFMAKSEVEKQLKRKVL